jgi:hypothetical protein
MGSLADRQAGRLRRRGTAAARLHEVPAAIGSPLICVMKISAVEPQYPIAIAEVLT